MTTPANLIAGLLAASGGHVSLSIVTPASGSGIGNNTTAEAITGAAQSSAGNITTLQYQIDGGAWNSFSFTPSPSVSYSGGNAGQIGAGNHVVTVHAIDAAANSTSVSANYTIAAAPPVTSYTWTPSNVYSGQNTYLTITNAQPGAAVGYTQSETDAHSDAVSTSSMIALGSTDRFGNFSYTGIAGWAPNAWTDAVQLYVGGVQVASFSFANVGVGPSYSYGPGVAPNGTSVVLSIANSWANSTVTQTIVFSPSGKVVGPAVLGSTSATGNFSYSGTASWGADTSCSTTVSLDGLPIGTFGFVP